MLNSIWLVSRATAFGPGQVRDDRGERPGHPPHLGLGDGLEPREGLLQAEEGQGHVHCYFYNCFSSIDTAVYRLIYVPQACMCNLVLEEYYEGTQEAETKMVGEG